MDDVDYLKRHGTEQAFVFVVDSARRDTGMNPEPNEYEIAFRAPFKHVVGLDLIHATVPRTEYVVERGRNSLVFTQGGRKHTVVVEPGDYNVLQLAEALTAALDPRLVVQAATVPAEVSNRVRLSGEAPFTVHVAESGLRACLGLGHTDLEAGFGDGVLGSLPVCQGPLPSVDSVDAITPVRQALAPPSSGSLSALRVYVSSSAISTVRVAVFDGAGRLVADGQAATTGVDFEQLEVSLAAAAKVQAGQTYYVALQGAARVFADAGAVSTALAGPGAAWWQRSWSGGSAAMCLDVDMLVDGFELVPPGVVNLTGEPYVLVRCPEFETELFRDRAYETVHTGLGLVTLGNYGYREQQYEFRALALRRLTVPKQLNGLTIRLERGDGTLYDTKGVDHHLVLRLTYLEITRAPDAATPALSRLNPHYTPNPLTFLQTQLQQDSRASAGSQGSRAPAMAPYRPMPHVRRF